MSELQEKGETLGFRQEINPSSFGQYLNALPLELPFGEAAQTHHNKLLTVEVGLAAVEVLRHGPVLIVHSLGDLLSPVDLRTTVKANLDA